MNDFYNGGGKMRISKALLLLGMYLNIRTKKYIGKNEDKQTRIYFCLS